MTEAEINKFMPALHELSPFLVDSGKEAKIKTGTFLRKGVCSILQHHSKHHGPVTSDLHSAKVLLCRCHLDVQGFLHYSSAYSSLQKQIGCFNHRVVTLVADKLKRQWLCIVIA